MSVNARHILATAVLALAASTGAHAADLYVGGSLGQSSWKVDQEPGVSLDKNDTGFKLLLGAQFSPNFAVEGGYVDLGKAKLSGSVGETLINGDIKGSGFFVDAVGKLPLSPQWAVFGKLGVFNGKAKLSGTTSTGQSGSDSDRGTDIKYGLGAEYALSKTVAIRGEWERYRFKVWGDKGDVDLVSVGVTFGF